MSRFLNVWGVLLGVFFCHATIAEPETFDMTGIWVGEVNNQGDRYRLVFNIEKQRNNLLTGTLDSPDKNIEGIVLGAVTLTEFVVTIAIPMAGAQYSGEVNEQSNSIKGDWVDPSGSYPIQFTRSVKKITVKPEKIPAELSERFETEHFRLYAAGSDKKVIHKIAQSLEFFYQETASKLAFEFKNKLNVLIYPDLNKFHQSIKLKNGPEWVVGAASYNKLMFVSPLNPGKAHDFESIIRAANHELVHVMALNFAKTKLPRWFDEGFAYWQAGQLDDEQKMTIKQLVESDKHLSWSELANVDSLKFGDNYGYPLSASIMWYLVHEFGYAKLSMALFDYSQFEKIYGQPVEKLEESWRNWILGLK